MRKWVGVFLALHAVPAAAGAAAPAAEHLVPESSEFTRASLPDHGTSLAPYYDMVLTNLKEAFAPSVQARVITMPSFEPEYAVGITEKDGAYSIFHLALKTQLWRYRMLESLEAIPPGFVPDDEEGKLEDAIRELKTSLPQDYREVGVERCETGISPALGRDILRVWRTMLLDTRYNDNGALGPDGTDYHFSMRGEAQVLAGKIWNPPAGSRTGKLVGIAETMKTLCAAPDRAAVTLIEQRLRGELDGIDD